MGIESLPFLCCFLPVLALLHALLRGRRARNWLLLAASLVFYAFSGLGSLALLLGCALVNYGFGLLLLGPCRGRQAVSALAVALDLAFLLAFKYLRLLVGAPEGWSLAAPLGLSFFVFKCLSYLLDLRRDPENGTRSLFRLLLYLFFFPQVTAGPISRFPDFAAQLTDRDPDPEGAALGLRRYLVGLGKKLLLASAAALADGFFVVAALRPVAASPSSSVPSPVTISSNAVNV